MARFNQVVTGRLLEGALSAFRRHGVAEKDVEVAWVPGSFEIPVVARRFARSGEVEAVVCLGAVVRGETVHFDLVAAEAARGVQQVAIETGVPCILGVLAADGLDQALERAGGKHGNKGWDAAAAAIEMASLMASLPKERDA